MEFSDHQKEAFKLRKLYEKFESKEYGRQWTTEELALGFVGDVGDLAKLILANEGVRNIPDHKAKLAHELSDCLWSIIVLAEKCDVDLESEFQKTIRDLTSHVTSKLTKKP